MKVSPDQLGKAILQELETYTEEVERKVATAVIYAGNEGAKDLRATTDKGVNTWKVYPKGWTTENKRRKGKQTSEIHNKTKYRLTHLLENGHVIKNGTGRTYGEVKPYPHIADVDTKTVDLLEKKILEAIQG